MPEIEKLKWKKPRHKNAYPWEYGPVRNLCAVLEEQFNTVDEKKKAVKWMWQIRYNDGHVGCPSWGYTETIEQAKREAEVWLRGFESCDRDIKDTFELLEKAKKYGWEGWMSGRLAVMYQSSGITPPKEKP